MGIFYGATPAAGGHPSWLKRNQLILSAALLALSAADWLLTRFIVNSGYAWEGNPLIREHVTDSGFGVIKILGTLLAILLMWDIFRRHPKIAQAFTILFVAAYAVIVSWNAYLAWTGGLR